MGGPGRRAHQRVGPERSRRQEDDLDLIEVRTREVVCSTASMDKHPQSQERGITLDLGQGPALQK